jgi:VIT1/CCC1 family predicted Fe2+/Mn2+ transporter
MTPPTRLIDDAAFGVVYGSITVMALLMTMHPPIENPGRQALILFGSVFAVALAKAYAEICERMLKSGNAATWDDVRAVWQHSQTVLLAAKGLAVVFALAALSLIPSETAFVLALVLAITLLGWFGGRIGWRIKATPFSVIVCAALTGGLGFLVTLLKFTLH